MSRQYEMWLLKQAGESADATVTSTLEWLSDPQFMKKPGIMRTYKRKRPECQAIEGVEELCRLCLNKPENGIAIFSDVSGYSPLATRIMFCCGLEITRDDNLSNIICRKCHKQVENFYTFRKMCEIVYQKLKQHVRAVRIKDNNKICNTDLVKDEKTNDSAENTTNDIENEVNVDTIDAEKSFNSQCIDPETIQMSSSIVLVFNESDTEVAGYNYNQYNVPVETSNINEDIVVVNNISQPTIKLRNEELLKESINNNKNKKLCKKTVDDRDDIKCSKQTVDLNNINFIRQTHNQPNNNFHKQPEQIGTITNNCPEVLAVSKKDDNVQTQKEIGCANVTKIQTSNELAIDVSSLITTELIATGTLMVDDSKLVVPKEINMVVELFTEDGSVVFLQLDEEDDNRKDDSLLSKDIQIQEKSKNTIKNQRNRDPEELLNNVVDSGDQNICKICLKLFSKRSVLRRHMRVHYDVRPYECSTCGRRFTQKEVMKRHQLVHAAKRPFACSRCPKSFTQRNGLLAHERSHMPAESRPLTIHTCSLCPKMFLYPSGLSRHMRTHNGRSYLCGECGRVIQDSSSLRRHVKICGGAASDARLELEISEVELNNT